MKKMKREPYTYIMFYSKIKRKKANVKKGFIKLFRVLKHFRLYLFYRAGGVAFQAVTLFWK